MKLAGLLLIGIARRGATRRRSRPSSRGSTRYLDEYEAELSAVVAEERAVAA